MAGLGHVGVPPRLRFRDELRNFARFIVRPRLGPRLPGRLAGSQVAADWLSGVQPGRLLKWALFLWAVNLLFLGPIAVNAALAAGAQHRLNIHAIPWLQALLWAPIVEELVFRYSLRRAAHALWLVPVAAGLMLSGPGTASVLLLCAVLLLCWSPWAHSHGKLSIRPRRPGAAMASGRRYRRLFPVVFHIANLVFAGVHLHNFNIPEAALWLLPLLVLPQWLTGLVLGWLRVQRGIGAAIVLHAVFNGGPLLIVWLTITLMPEMVS